MSAEHEKLLKKTINIEEEVIEALEKYAKEFTKETGKKWSLGAVVRLALAEFCTNRGIIV